MDFKEIQTEIAKLETYGRERFPKLEVDLSVRSGRSWVHMTTATIDGPKVFSGKDYILCRGDDPRDMFDEAWAILRALPDPEIVAKQNWQRNLGKVIDEGHALNLPDNVMAPLREGSQAMTENLLTFEAAE